MPPPIAYTIHAGYIPGCIGRIAELHGTYYHAHWNFGLFFEAKVAAALNTSTLISIGLSVGILVTNSVVVMEAIVKHLDAGESPKEAARKGAVVIDSIHAHSEGAHLRWFIVSEALRGRGAGRRLIESAIAFCRERQYARVYLWTFEGLDAARHLYESLGFKLIHQQEGTQWGTAVSEQRFELDVASSG